MATLLLADDSYSVARSVEQAFADSEIQVVSAASGERAIAQLEAEPPDVVLADIGLARINGYDIASYVKRSATLSHIPVLLLAGPFDPIDDDKARATGCDGVVLKPFQPALLVDTVRSLVDGKRPADLRPPDLPRTEGWGLETPQPAIDFAPSAPVAQPVSPVSQEDGFHWNPWQAGAPAVPSKRASRSLDEELDRLDAAFARTGPTIVAPLEDEDAACFAQDLASLRSSAPVVSIAATMPAPSTAPEQAPAALAVQPVAAEPVIVNGKDATTTNGTARTNGAAHSPEPERQHLKIKIKIGRTEFHAEGPADLVQAQFEEFKRMAAPKTKAAALAKVGSRDFPSSSLAAGRSRLQRS